jgi:hypothetical protein
VGATEGAVATAVAWQLTGMVDYVEYQLMFFFYKFISYVASYVGPIQTGFLMTFRKSYNGTGIMFPVKKHHRSRKYRNPEDSYRNYQPSP